MKKHDLFFGHGLPYIDANDLLGKLIVIEGTDGVGRTTQIENIKSWLEILGYGVITTGWTRSRLMKMAIDRAKAGHSLNMHTYILLYVADFADRLENEIIPALKSGFIVLADRYIYTAFARSIVRGARREWIQQVYGFALNPDAVLYMKIDIEDLIPRVINSETLMERYWANQSGLGMDYWESGMDLKLGDDFYDSFVEYQRRLLQEFELMAREMNFYVVDASKSFEEINRELKSKILKVLENG